MLSWTQRTAVEALVRARTYVWDARHMALILQTAERVMDGTQQEGRLLGDAVIRDEVVRTDFWMEVVHALFGEGAARAVSPERIQWEGGAGGERFSVHMRCGDWFLTRHSLFATMAPPRLAARRASC